MALHEAGADFSITAYDSNAQHAEYLRDQGVVDSVAATANDAVRDADIVMLATPLRCYPELARAIAPSLKSGVIMTDVGSVKASMERLTPLLPNARIIPGHPIAGTEKSGPKIATSALFRNRLMILTPPENADEEAITIVQMLWQLAGAELLSMPVAVHDQVYAHVSHLPHFIAFVTAEFFYTRGIRVADDDTMLQQFLRISRSNARMWTDVALENREALLSALTTYSAILEHFITELKSGEAGSEADATQLTKSLLPRILASALISNVSLTEQQSGMSLRGFAGAGMRDISAPAALPPDEDTLAISNAAGGVAKLLEQLLPAFKTLEQLIGAEDEPALFAALSRMTEHAHALVAVKN
jgi:prephenate dehydrogenase